MRFSIFASAILCVVLCGAAVSTVAAQSYAPPSNDPAATNISAPINTGTTTQIKRGSLGIDLSGTLLSSYIPTGAGLYMKAGALFIEKTSGDILAGWVAPNATDYSVSTNGRVKAHGFVSSGIVQSDVLKHTGGASENPVCVDPQTGNLKLCGISAVIPTVSITANPATLETGETTAVSWTSNNAVSCIAIPPSPGSFTTGGLTNGTQSFVLTLPPPGTVSTTVTFAVRCTSSTNNIASDSVVVTVTPIGPGPSITFTATPQI